MTKHTDGKVDLPSDGNISGQFSISIPLEKNRKYLLFLVFSGGTKREYRLEIGEHYIVVWISSTCSV